MTDRILSCFARTFGRVPLLSIYIDNIIRNRTKLKEVRAKLQKAINIIIEKKRILKTKDSSHEIQPVDSKLPLFKKYYELNLLKNDKRLIVK